MPCRQLFIGAMASCLDQMAGVARVALRSLLPGARPGDALRQGDTPRRGNASRHGSEPDGEGPPNQLEANGQAAAAVAAAAAEVQGPMQHLAIEMGQARPLLSPVRTRPHRGSSSSLEPAPQQASPLSPLGSAGGTCRRRRSSSMEGAGMRPAGSSPSQLQRWQAGGTRSSSQEAGLQRGLSIAASDVSALSVYAVRRDPTFKVRAGLLLLVGAGCAEGPPRLQAQFT